MRKLKPDYFFEVSYNLFNKDIDLSQHIHNKSKALVNLFGSKYFLVGRLDECLAQKEIFFPLAEPDFLSQVFEELKKEGIFAVYGKLKIEGEPGVILLDFGHIYSYLDLIKREFWDFYKIDTFLNNSFDDEIVFGYAVSRFLYIFSKLLDNCYISSQFYDIESAFAILYLNFNQNKNLKTIFTLSKSCVGLYLAKNNLQKKVEIFDKKTKFASEIEKHAANKADLFSVISKSLKEEVRDFYGISPKLVFSPAYYIKNHNMISSFQAREKIRFFLFKYLYPDLVDLREYKLLLINADDIFFSGLNLLIKALKQVSDKKVILFVLGNNKEKYKLASIFQERNEIFNDTKKLLEEKRDFLDNIILYSFFKDKNVDFYKYKSELSNLFSVEKQLKKQKIQRDAISLFQKIHLSENYIVKFLLENGFDRFHKNIKVIYLAKKPSKDDLVFNMNYLEFLSGFDLCFSLSSYNHFAFDVFDSVSVKTPVCAFDNSFFGEEFKDFIKRKVHKGIYFLSYQKKENSFFGIKNVIEELSKNKIQKLKEKEALGFILKHSLNRVELDYERAINILFALR